MESGLLTRLKEKVSFRDSQIDLLSVYLQPYPDTLTPAMFLEGPPSAGKSLVIDEYTKILKANYKFLVVNVQCELSLTKRRILQKILKGILDSLNMNFPELNDVIMTCDGISTFLEILKQMLLFYEEDTRKKHDPIVVVLDKIDHMLESDVPGSLCAALSRLHEQSPVFTKISFIFVATRTDFMDLVTFNTCRILFTGYDLGEVKEILTKSFTSHRVMGILNKDLENTTITVAQLRNYITQFIQVVIDSYSSYFGSDIQQIRSVLQRLWPYFYKSFISHGKYEVGVNDLITIYYKHKKILQSEIGIPAKFIENGDEQYNSNISGDKKNDGRANLNKSYDFNNRTKYILIAAYLASYNDPKYDLYMFTREKDTRANSRGRSRAKRSKTAVVSESHLRMMSPQSFSIERLLAILSAIYDKSEERGKIESDIDLYTEIATMTELKVLVQVSTADMISGFGKWRCNLNWGTIKRFSDDVKFEVENYLEF